MICHYIIFNIFVCVCVIETQSLKHLHPDDQKQETDIQLPEFRLKHTLSHHYTFNLCVLMCVSVCVCVFNV